MISEKQKFAIDYVIALNPTTVTLSRVEYTEDEGARKKTETSVKAQTWLVFPKSPNSLNATESRNEGGMADVLNWGALAPSTADVKYGAHVTDSFVMENVGTLEVVSGCPIMVGSDVNGYQLELRLVK